jgi:hypothetical protein
MVLEEAWTVKEDEAKGLLVIWSDVDADYRIEYQKWHNCEHMTERVSIPGFHVGRRYQGVAGAPEFLMYYETENSKVLASKAYLDSQNNPTPWTKEAIPHLKNIMRAIYSLVASSGKKAPTEAVYIHLVKFNAAPGFEQKAIKWFKESHLPDISALAGVYRARLYKMDDEVSNISTEERKIHGGGPGQQKFLAYYELANLDLPDSVGWIKASSPFEADAEAQIRLEDVIRESYWLDFTMDAPKG